MSDVATIDRVSVRHPPRGWPVMYQTWDKLLFLHWRVDAERLRPLIPAGLEIDTWDSSAWIGVTPFTIPKIRPPLVPSVPLLCSSHELNVRTYVHREGVPGVWFLSLDASNWLAVCGARLGFCLPYFHAAMKFGNHGERYDFRSMRTRRSNPANFSAIWQRGRRVPEAAPESLDYFLIERYCLYSTCGGRLYRSWIHHRPWPLCSAHVEQLTSSVIASHGLPEPTDLPYVHAQAEPLHVRIWPPRQVG